jgi:NAD(P) transhydrogenase subunit alpha
MMKNNVVEIDWSDEILAATVLTHAGQNKADSHDRTGSVAVPPAQPKTGALATSTSPPDR